ncbi:MAG: threonine synthase [Candidatus Margulisbacteria bacterium]|nr:threonine synthase [Candidatus Margulisiibacteriota bacterium]
MWKGLIDQYSSYLPVSDNTPIVTLLEGNTPLIKLENLTKHFQIPADWYVKFEGLNPTGSFKDRGMTLAISKAKEEGAKVVMCASTGNTSASAAAYAAKANLTCCVIIPEGKIALGKLAQAMMHGAIVLQIKGNFDDALTTVRDITDSTPIALVNSVNPYRIEGQKTGSFEIIDQLGYAPDFHFIPVGNAGNITAYWKGYQEYHAKGKSKILPKMMGWQAAGAAPIVHGKPVSHPDTIATAIRIGNPASWEAAVSARDESGGIIESVTDEEITQAQKQLAAFEGIFCEPASAASIAGVLKKHATGLFQSGQTIVSILTGHGLKDPNRAIDISSKPQLIDGKKDTILKALSPYLS